MKRVRPDSSSYRKPVSNECMHILTKISMVDFFFFFPKRLECPNQETKIASPDLCIQQTLHGINNKSEKAN